MTVPVKASANYNDNSKLQQQAISSMMALLPTDFQGKSITVADYGSCEGQNSVLLVHQLLSALPDLRAANIIFNDQPNNDFSCLAKTIEQNMQALACNGRLDVFPSMIPRSFKEKVIADGSVNVGLCNASLHWLSPESPGIGHQYFPPMSVAGPVAHQELVSFLALRAREILPGGTLILGIAGKGEFSFEPGLRCLSLAIDDLESDGRIPASVASTCRSPVYFRTAEEINMAVEAEGSWTISGRHDTALPEASELWLARGQKPGEDSQNLDEEFRTKLCDHLSSTIIGSSGNTILTAVRKQTGDFDEIRLLQDLSDRFKHHFFEQFTTGIGGHFYYLRLSRK
ncbi:S-adenosyl-L-methionine-dependent methyltransferase [Aspergillus avenaceus]|uniref:S-adenosyl-L-methionine-dependent methyltransferase n=1 Tax=Aspergillus avenaceus TaxID=36643 RepID=A0A5N6TUL5_ASPAV|nr:S-adenosyl-L-methionine-dependent methyltransferase [Aspergillus avenaceus]